MIELPPKIIDLSQDWLVKYWAGELGASRGRLAQAVSVIGPQVSKVTTYLKGGYRLAIRDLSGVPRQVARITLEKGGFGVSVPYHPARRGWITGIPLTYA